LLERRPSVLLHGLGEWDETLLPADEYHARQDLWRGRQAALGLAGTLLYGDSDAYGVLAYFAQHVPRMGWAVLALPTEGPPVLFAAVLGARELTVVQEETPVADVRPASDLPGYLSSFASLPFGLASSAPLPRREEALLRAARAAGPPFQDVGAEVAALMAAKRPRERLALAEAAGVLAAAFSALAAADDPSPRLRLLAAEREARRRGAFEVRALWSRDGRHFHGYEALVPEGRGAPFTVYLAVSRRGYWAEALQTVAGGRDDRLRAEARLDALLARLAGGSAGTLPKVAGAHPAVHGIGLSPVEPCLVAHASPEPGQVLALHVAAPATVGGTCHLTSALVYASESGPDVLWRPPPLEG
jgi:hypothetical protein